MPSKNTATKQPITIRLKYNADGTVTSTPPSPVQFKKGDLVQFVSGRGDKVYVKLNPKAYQPSQFTPDSGPVKVITDPSGRSKAQCGILRKVNGEDVPYGDVPGHPRPKVILGFETEP